MIRFFSTGYLSRYLLILLIGIVVWLPSLLFPTSYSGISSYAYNQLLFIVAQNNYVITSASFILALVTAFFLNQLAISSGFISKVSTLVAFLYIVFTSSIVGESHNNPVIWINFIMVLVLANLVKLPYITNSIPIVFNASFLLGIASLFYSQLVFLIFFIWVAIFIHRIVSWRNIIVSIVGVVLPYFLLLTWFFYRDILLEESYVLFDSLRIDIAPALIKDKLNMVISSILLSITIISVFGIAGKLTEKNINLRRNIIITLYYIVIVFLVLLFSSKSLISVFLLGIPAVIILGHWLCNIKHTRWYNIALSLVTILIVVNQYLYLLFRL